MKYFSPALALAIVIAWLSTTGEVRLPTPGLSIDKIGHALAYGVLSWLMHWGLYKTQRQNLRNSIVLCLIAGAYGIGLEFVQKWYFPGRFFEVLDIVANICGIIIGAVAFRITHTQNA